VREDFPDDRGIVQRGDQAEAPSQWAHVKTSMPNGRCIRAAQLQARGLPVFTLVPSGPAPQWRRREAKVTAARPYLASHS
jgi:hypothetical protein